MVRHYLKIAFRNLFKYKTQSTISIFGLAIGFMAFLLGGYWYYWEHRFDTFHPASSHTYAITTSGLSRSADGSEADLNQLHVSAEKEFRTYPEIEKVCHANIQLIRADDKMQQWMGLEADSVFFDLFQCDLIEGTYRQIPFNGQFVLLTQTMATTLFGNQSCVGQVVKLSSEVSFTVAGVMKNYPQNSDFKFDYINLAIPKRNSVKRQVTYVKIYQHADVDKLRQKIEAYRMEEEDTEWSQYSQWRFHLRTLPDVHLRCSPELNARFRNINILATAGALTFISALMNLLVLFIGQQQRKVRYTLTFTTMGASFKSLIGKNLIELSLLLLLAFVLSMALFELVFPFYLEYTKLQPESISIFHRYVQTISGKEAIQASFILYPVSVGMFLSVSLFPIIGLLKRKRHATSGLLRNGLIAGQIFIGGLFILISLVFYSQYRFMNQTDKGFVTDHIWQMNLGFDASYHQDCTPLIASLLESPFIEDVTALHRPIISPDGLYYCTYISHLPIEGRDTESKEEDDCVVVNKNFLSFFGMKMKEGEWIANEGAEDIVVNETGARQLNIPALTGRTLQSSAEGSKTEKLRRISGILADYYYCPMQFPIKKVFFRSLSYAEMGKNYMGPQFFYLKIRPENQKKALEHARKVYSNYEKGEIEPEQQFIYLPEIMDALDRPEKMMFRIFLLLGSLCILISSFGIYSLVALSTEQRKKEIAIRKVNGALFRDILRIFLKEYLWLALIGNAVALPLGYLFLSYWLETYAYHTSLSAGHFLLVFLLSCLLVIFSVARQVICAVRQNPAEVIKSE